MQRPHPENGCITSVRTLGDRHSTAAFVPELRFLSFGTAESDFPEEGSVWWSSLCSAWSALSQEQRSLHSSSQ